MIYLFYILTKLFSSQWNILENTHWIYYLIFRHFLLDWWTQICGSLPVCPSIIFFAQQYRALLLSCLALPHASCPNLLKQTNINFPSSWWVLWYGGMFVWWWWWKWVGGVDEDTIIETELNCNSLRILKENTIRMKKKKMNLQLNFFIWNSPGWQDKKGMFEEQDLAASESSS